MSDENRRNAAANVIDLYRRHAIRWLAARGSGLPEHIWINRFASALPQCANVLDIGCGSGQPIALYLSLRGHAITGVDSSPAMLDCFHANLANAETVLADMRGLSLGRKFGGVIAWDSFFHLSPPDQRAMFPIFAQHAAPQAPLMFTSGPAAGEAIGSLEGEPLYHASLAPEEYHDLLNQNGFAVVAHVANDPDAAGRTVWLARHL